MRKLSFALALATIAVAVPTIASAEEFGVGVRVGGDRDRDRGEFRGHEEFRGAHADFRDRNGVTTIPNHLASATAQACPELAAAESIVLDYLKSGKIDPKGYAAARNECKNRVDALARKLKGLL